jgi:DNA-binding GntR family transcriptional regulator
MRVPQDAIAHELGVSRIPVREALIMLEAEGWVTSEIHRGAFINTLDERTVLDHYELFGLVYGLAVRRALERTPSGLAGRLTDILEEFKAATDPEDLQRLSIAFHDSIVRAADSNRIAVVLRAISTLVPVNFFAAVPDAVDIERKGLTAIVRAVRQGDGDRASAEYGKMMRRVGHCVAAMFEARGLYASVQPAS